MDTKQIVESLDLIPNVKDRFMSYYDSLDAGKRLSVESAVWRAWDAIYDVRVLEYFLIEKMRRHIPDRRLLTDVILEDVPPEIKSRIIKKAEEDQERYPRSASPQILRELEYALREILP